MNLPCKLDLKSHSPTAVPPASILPKSTFKVGSIPSPLICEPIMSKSINNPFSLSTISGCAEVILRFLASPKPLFWTNTAKEKGSDTSVASVKGSSPNTSL